MISELFERLILFSEGMARSLMYVCFESVTESSGYDFSKISSYFFMIFEVDFGHAETGCGAKKRVVLRREIRSFQFQMRKRCLNKVSFSRLWVFVHKWLFDFDIHCFPIFTIASFSQSISTPFLV